jgi:hypothetical protein
VLRCLLGLFLSAILRDTHTCSQCTYCSRAYLNAKITRYFKTALPTSQANRSELSKLRRYAQIPSAFQTIAFTNWDTILSKQRAKVSSKKVRLIMRSTDRIPNIPVAFRCQINKISELAGLISIRRGSYRGYIS